MQRKKKHSTTLTSENKKPAHIGAKEKILQLSLAIPCHGSKVESVTLHPPFGLQCCEIQQSFLISFCNQTKSYKVMIQHKFSMSSSAPAETRFRQLGLFAIQ